MVIGEVHGLSFTRVEFYKFGLEWAELCVHCSGT